MFNFTDVKHWFKIIPARNPLPPTRKDVIEFWTRQDVVVLLEPEESISVTDYKQVSRIYGRLLLHLWVNYENWVAGDVQQLCIRLNIYFKSFAFISLMNPDSFETKKEWTDAKECFVNNFNMVCDDGNIV